MAIMGETRKRKRKGIARGVQSIGSDPNWEKNYQCEEDLRAVARSEAVHKDPERMAAVKALAKEKLEESKRREDEAKVMVDLGEGKDV